MQKPNFDLWIVRHWPKDVPGDCTRLDDDAEDCLQRSDLNLCPSCALYEEMAGDYYRLYEESE